MKLSNIRDWGRWKNKESGKSYNIKRGRRAGYGTDHLFYLFRGKRMYISEKDFYGGNWEKEGLTQIN